jgi:hypothetical protein
MPEAVGKRVRGVGRRAAFSGREGREVRDYVAAVLDLFRCGS